MKSKLITVFLSFFLVFAVEGYGQGITVTGVVLDNLGEGLPGAAVTVKGTTVGTITDFDGHFAIQVKDAKSVVQASFIGYRTQEVVVGNQKQLKIVLQDDSKMIDEVVVVAFGTQKKANVSGATKTIDNKVLSSRPIASASQGLQGAIAGLNITNDNGGGLGQSMNINIRGAGTIGQGSNSSPLVLIDGIEGDIESINPNDIASISVLKDASSAAIYGSRAPFGVILITTKSGSRETQVTYSGNVRLSDPISVPQPVDSHSFALMVNDAYLNSGGSAQFGAGQLEKILKYQRGELQYGIEKVPDKNEWMFGQRSYGNTDWYDVFLKKYSTSQEHNMNLSGGNEKVVYYFSANYLGQSGLFNYAEENFTRLSISGKVNVKINNRLQFNWNTRFVNTDNEKPSALNDLFFHNLGRRSPLMPVEMPNGEYNKESLIPAIKDGGRTINKNKLLYNQAQFTYEPIKNWKVYADLGSRIEMPSSTRQFRKLQYSLPDGTMEDFLVLEGINDKAEIKDDGSFNRSPGAGISYFEKMNGGVNYFNTNIRTDYEMTLDKHFFKVLVGLQTEYFYTEKTRVASDDILLDELPFLPSTSGVNTMMSDKKGEWATVGMFGRINYSYADRYMAEINVRRDGASRFPPTQRWGTFSSFSLAWNIAQETFFAPLAERGFDMFKLRGSYGTLGNQNTSNFYPYFQQMAINGNGGVNVGNSSTILLGPEPYATRLTWEKIENAGAGIDIALFANRLTATFDWYQRSTLDMVGPAKSLPGVFGAKAPKTNNAEMRTRGWELELGWRDIVNKDFSYGITGTLSDYTSVVTQYDSPTGDLKEYYSGKKMGDIWGYTVQGIAKNDKEMNEWLVNNSQTGKLGNGVTSKWGGGDLMYKDLDGNKSVDRGSGSITDHGDLRVIGNGTPRFAFGLSLDATYKFIDIRAFFQGIGKRDVFFDNSATFFGFAGEWQRSLYTDHFDYFRFAGAELGANFEDPYYARLRTDKNNQQVCDYYLQDASYIRLKNLQIGFNLPKNTKLAKYVKKARLYVSGENLFTLTNLRIYDPESIGSSISEFGPGKAYPMYRVWSVGLEVTF